MTLSGRYFNPGPVEIDPEVAQAMLRPMIPHRGAEAQALVGRLQPGLCELFGTTRPVMLTTGSATSMMEAAIRGGVRDRALCIVSGLFGERMADTAERCDKEVVRLHVPHGAVLEPEQLEQMLDGPPVDAVTMVHCETSSGALAPVADLIARLRRFDDVVTIVDAVSSLGGVAVELDRWGADFIFTGSQKAIGTPPGLAFGAASERFIERAKSADSRGFYLDVVDLLQAATESRFPQTPALPVVYALERQLERIAREGIANRFDRHRAMREMVEAWVARHGKCGIFAPPGRRADTVTALTLRDGLSATALVAALAAEGWTVAAGIGAETDRIIRIGHMGDVRPDQLALLLEALEPRL